MARIDALTSYRDDNGNTIEYTGSRTPKTDVEFKGKNNTLRIDADATVAELKVSFWGDNGIAEVGPTTVQRAPMRFELRIGHDSEIRIGQDVGCAGRVFISAVEGADVVIGNDIMFSQSIEIRTDDSHAIYDSKTGERVNVSESILIGSHVWIGKHVVIMGGVTVGDGSVIGFRSIVTRSVPNNCIAVGSPARVVRSDIAWERPMVAAKRPNEKFAPKSGRTLQFWHDTIDDDDDDDDDGASFAE